MVVSDLPEKLGDGFRSSLSVDLGNRYFLIHPKPGTIWPLILQYHVKDAVIIADRVVQILCSGSQRLTGAEKRSHMA